VVLQAGHTSAEWPAKERAQALRMPSDCCELLDLTVRERHALGHLAAAGANALGEWLKTLDAWRRPQRAEDLLEVLRILAPSNLRPVGLRLQSALHAGISIDAAAVVRSAQASGLSGPSLGEAVHLARIQAIATVP
jgi:tRNA nucleotidyltransferase (CCA-adding enzyme)